MIYAFRCFECNISYEGDWPMGEAPRSIECEECEQDAGRDVSTVRLGVVRSAKRSELWNFDKPKEILCLPPDAPRKFARNAYEARKTMEYYGLILHPHDESGIHSTEGRGAETITREMARRLVLGQQIEDPREQLRQYQNTPTMKKARQKKMARLAREEKDRKERGD